MIYVNGILVNLDENTASVVSREELDNDLRVFRKKSVFGQNGVEVIDIPIEQED